MSQKILEDRKLHLGMRAKAALPWGPLFATSMNFKHGFAVEEGRLVARYLRKPSDILIIGSGNGREARPICRDGHRIVCIDIGLFYLQSGKRLFSAEGCANVLFVSADMHLLPFAENSFDFVFFSLFSFAQGRQLDLLKQLHRLLRPEGHILVMPVTALYRPVPGLLRIDTLAELCRALTACPFGVLEGAVEPDRPEYFSAVLRAVDTESGTANDPV